MENLPRVTGNGFSKSLRFTIPKISFSPETLAAHEERAGIPYLSILEAVTEVTPPDGPNAAQERRRLESTAQGMLCYLSRLWSEKSKVSAMSPPLNSSMVTHWRRKYPFFDATCHDFEQELADIAEQELYERAVIGSEHPIVVDKEVTYVVKKSDDLLKFYLTHNRPRRYSQKAEVLQKTEISGPGGGPIATIDRTALKNMSDEDLAALEELLSKGTE